MPNGPGPPAADGAGAPKRFRFGTRWTTPESLFLDSQYFGSIGKAASRAGQRSASSGAVSEPVARVSKVVSDAGRVEAPKPAVFLRPHPVTFYPAQMRMAL